MFEALLLSKFVSSLPIPSELRSLNDKLKRVSEQERVNE